ncbi:uncharacterized protein LOC125657201 isoform X3 [Ostrea edulis]|uniref:uncharacterized protein LOC125657201 isoform X3 n=1 Tax=Ostrea edulis TaxID=37623 RepID=UPI0024AF78B4|nr:uncharacterized protein LOC125657201 isoform X3 [Ostrea edulis]
MPVHFKTEYKQNYLPLQSKKSASFHPLPEQVVDPAGKESTKLGLTIEPPLQRKKRCTGPPTSLSTDFNQFPDSASDEYALLGRNDKFMENVRYKSKARQSHPLREASPPKQQRLQKKENRGDFRQTHAPFVDTSKFRQRSKAEEQPSTPLTPRKEKNESSSLYKEIALKEKEAALREKFIKLDKEGERQAALREKFSKLDKEGERKAVPSKLRESKEKYSKTIKENRMESAVKAWAKDKDIGSMNEFAQTNLDKGVADSAPEAPADYSLRYKTGVSAPRPRRHKFSEYQKAFEWKSGAKASPMLAAEQAVVASESKNKVVYNSNPALIPPQKTFIKDSEYAAQFKQHHAAPVSSDDLKAVPRTEKQRSKVRRTKSTGSVRVDKRPPAGSGPVISSDNKRQTIESELQGETKEVPPPPPINQGQLKRPRSEYYSNFRSPTKYQYDGAWHGADPPHLQPTREAAEEKSVRKSGPADESAPALTNWFAEVIELRRKASEYKKRAQGTHFSREHLVQLIAQQAQAWDSLSTARSGSTTLSALSLESGASVRLQAQQRLKIAEEKNFDDKNDIKEANPTQISSANKNKSKQSTTSPDKLESTQFSSKCKSDQIEIFPKKTENKQSASKDKSTQISPHKTASKQFQDKSNQISPHKTASKQFQDQTNVSHSDKTITRISQMENKLFCPEKLNFKNPQELTKSTGPEKVNNDTLQFNIENNQNQKMDSKECKDSKEVGTKLSTETVGTKLSTETVGTKLSTETVGTKLPTEAAVKSKRVEKLKKSGDDVSMMAHEGSDEEIGKPDFRSERHLDLTAVQRGRQKRAKKAAWQEEAREVAEDDISLVAYEGSDIGRSELLTQKNEKTRGRGKFRSRRKREEDEASDITPVLKQSSKIGRIPTPKLRSKSASSTRHHLDRTTPVVGGAMLSSPPRPERKLQVKVSRSWCTPQDVYDDDVSTVVSSDKFVPAAGQSLTKTYDVKKGPIETTPTFGQPSKDTHFLRDDDVSVDQPLQTVFVDSPAKLRQTADVSSGDEKPARKIEKPTKFTPQQAIKEGYGQTYNKPMSWGIEGGMVVPRIEDDCLSLSERSVASSCSLASEVYERARKRTQEFWGKDGIASR